MARTIHSLGILIAILALSALPARSAEPAAGTIRIDMRVVLDARGVAELETKLDFPRPAYRKLKAIYPDPTRFTRLFDHDRADFDIQPGAKARYDDAESAVATRHVVAGAARNRGAGLWEMPVSEPGEFINVSGTGSDRPVVYFYASGDISGLSYRGQWHLTLPQGAKDVQWIKASRLVRYRLPAIEVTGKARLDVTLQSKTRLMSALYKVYGLGTDHAAMWIGKGVLKNEGDAVIRNLRVRYRLEGYAGWSPWQRHAEIVPGQTAVSLYHPVLESKIAELTSNTPANLLMEWRYEDSAGKEREDSAAKRVTILGRHEFVFSNMIHGERDGNWHDETNNAPFLAAWVARDDLVVKEFAAMANKLAGGVGAGSNDKSALRVLRSCYELMQHNDFTYQHPPGLLDRSISYDPASIQNIKFPRDVIRDRSGTCVDLAILYASMATSLGLDARLALVPGHCFPVIRLPSGEFVGIETTGVQGGVRHGTAPFSRVLVAGSKELYESGKSGLLHLLDVRALWTQGIANPELRKLPADILKRWKITMPDATRPSTPATGDAAQRSYAPAPSQRVVPASRTPRASDLVGTWRGQMKGTRSDGKALVYACEITIKRASSTHYDVVLLVKPTYSVDGVDVAFLIAEKFVLRQLSPRMPLQGRLKMAQPKGRPDIDMWELPVDTGHMTLARGTLSGRLSNPDGSVSFTTTRVSRTSPMDTQR